MKETILMAHGDQLTEIPFATFEEGLTRFPEQAATRLSFMTTEHHLVRNFVVRELPRAGAPITPECIAEKVQLPIDRVQAILDDLERHMTFLFRNVQGAVAWAYPVTVEPTPHRLSFRTGETLYAA